MARPSPHSESVSALRLDVEFSWRLLSLCNQPGSAALQGRCSSPSAGNVTHSLVRRAVETLSGDDTDRLGSF